jgi:hypothetical protein
MGDGHAMDISVLPGLFPVLDYGDQIFTCGSIEGCETSISQVTRRCSFTSTLYFIFLNFKLNLRLKLEFLILFDVY